MDARGFAVGYGMADDGVTIGHGCIAGADQAPSFNQPAARLAK